MECGIVGLPDSGKTSLFQALTAHAVEIDTLKPNIAQADIPNPRLTEIREFIPTRKIVPARLDLEKPVSDRFMELAEVKFR